MKNTKLLAASLILAFGMTGCAEMQSMQQSIDSKMGSHAAGQATTGAIAGGVVGGVLCGKYCALAGAAVGGVIGGVHGHGIDLAEAQKVAAEIRQESHYHVAVHQSYMKQQQQNGSYQRVAYMDKMTLAVPDSAIHHHAPLAERTLMKIGTLSAKTEKHTLLVQAKNQKDFDYIKAGLQAGSQQPLNVVYAGKEKGRDALITLQNDVMYASNAGSRV